MALGFLLILSTAAMPRPHCLRERCVSELLLLTLMCVCVSTAGPIFLSGVCIWWLSMKMMSWDKEKERDTEAVMKCCRDVYTQIIFHVYFCPWRRRQTCDRTCQRRRLAVFSPCHSSRMYLSISWQFFRRQSQFLTPHSVQSAAPLRLVLVGARETDGDHGKKNS